MRARACKHIRACTDARSTRRHARSHAAKDSACRFALGAAALRAIGIALRRPSGRAPARGHGTRRPRSHQQARGARRRRPPRGSEAGATTGRVLPGDGPLRRRCGEREDGRVPRGPSSAREVGQSHRSKAHPNSEDAGRIWANFGRDRAASGVGVGRSPADLRPIWAPGTRPNMGRHRSMLAVPPSWRPLACSLPPACACLHPLFSPNAFAASGGLSGPSGTTRLAAPAPTARTQHDTLRSPDALTPVHHHCRCSLPWRLCKQARQEDRTCDL